MAFKDFLGNLFKIPVKSVSAEAVVSTEEDYRIMTNAVNAFAFISCIEMIASICAAAELETYKDGKKYQGLEWHSLNVRPNVNQSATEFWKEFYCKLIYEGEALIINANGQKILADSFNIDEYALRDNVFTQVTRGNFTFSKAFQNSEVFYIKYSNHNVQGYLSDILNVYNNLFNEAANKYIKSGGSKGVLEVTALPTGDADTEEKYAESIDRRLKKFNQAKDGVLTLFEGMKYTSCSSPSNAKSSNEINDIKLLFDGAVTRAAQALKIPPQLMLGDVSGINDAIDLMLTVCIDPLLNAVSEELSGKEFSAEEYLKGNFIKADTSNIKHIDIFSLAPNVEKLITSAFASVDEVREKAGLVPTGEEWAQKHFSTKNQDFVENLWNLGGENNALRNENAGGESESN